MGRLYLRRVVLDIVPRSGSTIRIDGLRIKFRIEKTSKGHPNASKIEIFNLSDATVALLQTPGVRVILSAGYQSSFTKRGDKSGVLSDFIDAFQSDQTDVLSQIVEEFLPDTATTVISSLQGLTSDEAVSLFSSLVPSNAFTSLNVSSTVEPIFKGSVTKAKHKKSSKSDVDPVKTKMEGADLITELEVQDGIVAFRNQSFTKGYPQGAKLKDIMGDLTQAAGVPVASLDGVPDLVYANGITLQGLVRDHLFTLCDSNNLSWSIQDETLVIVPKEQSTKEAAIIVSADTGLVGIPMKTSKGCEFKSLLQGGFRIGRQVILDSRILKGNFKIVKLEHEGDSWTGDFQTHCETWGL